MPFFYKFYIYGIHLKITVVNLIALKEVLYKYLGMGLSLADVDTERIEI